MCQVGQVGQGLTFRGGMRNCRWVSCVDELMVRFVKIADADNCADMFTKPVDHAKFCHLLSHTHQHAAQAKRREPVVEG